MLGHRFFPLHRWCEKPRTRSFSDYGWRSINLRNKENPRITHLSLCFKLVSILFHSASTLETELTQLGGWILTLGFHFRSSATGRISHLQNFEVNNFPSLIFLLWMLKQSYYFLFIILLCKTYCFRFLFLSSLIIYFF